MNSKEKYLGKVRTFPDKKWQKIKQKSGYIGWVISKKAWEEDGRFIYATPELAKNHAPLNKKIYEVFLMSGFTGRSMSLKEIK